jgi:hypothetical protein
MKQPNTPCAWAALALALPMMAGTTDAGAVEPVDRFFVSVGAYKADNDVKLRWDPSSGDIPGTHVSVKRDLGLPLGRTEPFFEIGGTIGRHHQLKAFHYGYDARKSKILDKTLIIGDDVYHESAVFDGDLDISLLGTSYTWLFHHNEVSAFGVGLGAIRYKVGANLAATLSNDDGSTETASGSISEAQWAPLLRAEYAHSLGEHWRIGFDAAYVRKSGSKVSGSATDFNAKVEYFPWEHFGFALRYNYNDINLEFDRKAFRGKIDINNRGPQLVATYRF